MRTFLLIPAFIAASTVFIASCSGSKKTTVAVTTEVRGDHFVITTISKDSSYAYSEKNPVNVGGVADSEGPLNERRYLNALAGPNGEVISYQRVGNCCSFRTPNGFDGMGLLDRYEVTWEGLEAPLILFINMYDPGQLSAPVGMTIK